MKDKRKLDDLQLIVSMISIALMIITFAVQIIDFVFIRHIILCLIIIVLTIVAIVIDTIIKEHKRILSHTILCSMWSLNLILSIIFN